MPNADGGRERRSRDFIQSKKPMKIQFGRVAGVESLRILAPLCAISSLLILPGQLAAQVTLSDGGSTATVDLTGGGGMNSWTVLGGQNQLQQQWFYYSINSGAVNPINALGLLGDTTTANSLDVLYGNSQLSVEVDY